MNALANAEVGTYVNEFFCCSYQKVATFKIVGRQKQGGNVATYFCAPDGRVLHCIAGPVNAGQFLQEAKWVVDTAKKAIAYASDDGARFKAYMRQAHAQKLKLESGLAVEPITFDPPELQNDNDALTYRDPTGRSLAPKLPPPPLDGPDVQIKAEELQKRQFNEAKAPGAALIRDRAGRTWQLGNQGRVDQILAAHCMIKIEKVYGTIFENILGEKISTKPVEVTQPFTWLNQRGERLRPIR